MRALFWILGAVATAAAGAFVLDRRGKRRLAESFLSALHASDLSDLAYEAGIIAPGLRAELFRGRLDGKPFAFVARADASGTHWTYALAWGEVRMGASWNTVSEEADHPFSQAYAYLRRRLRKDDGLSN